MADQYDFGNLSPIEFEALVADLLGEELGVTFETFSEGADGGIDARFSTAKGDIILQAKHYKESTWSDLKTAAKNEHPKIIQLNPKVYHFLTSQKLTPSRKTELKICLSHESVLKTNIRGRTEINALLRKHGAVERRNIKLWLSSTAVLQRLLNNDIAVFTEATMDGIGRVLKVFVENPSLPKAATILNKRHCLIVSGPPGVGKTTLAQVLAAEYCDEDWELVAITSIEEGHRAFHGEKKQVFIFDDFLGTTKLERATLSRDDSKIASFMAMVSRRDNKRFILTTRKYILQAARSSSEALDGHSVDLSEMVLDLDVYTREIKARILYNHLYHSSLKEEAINELLESGLIPSIVDHKHYMPRIVEWMTDHLRFEDHDPSTYPKAFLAALDSPDKIWEKPFLQHISQAARIVLYCMYFSKRDGFIEKGVRISALKPFFLRAIEAFGVPVDGSLRQTLFEDTLRELKSSFVLFDTGKVEFINPSVQDFLARQLDDGGLLGKLAASAPTLNHAVSLWSIVTTRFKTGSSQSRAVAKASLLNIQSGNAGGRIALEDVGEAIGDMLLDADSSEFRDYLRDGGLQEQIWINDVELPSIIDDLMFGKFSDFSHAQAYGRLLRIRLFKFLSEREHVLEIEELGILADNLNSYREELPECIQEQFEEAAYESVDSLEVTNLPRGSDPESTVGDWLEQMDKIEGYLGRSVSSSKRDELDSFMGQIQWQHEMEMERHREDRRGLRRSASVKNELPSPVAPSGLSGHPREGFSDKDLGNMFSSLKK
ncbi:restriction endonuclease [Ruegeria pomeroyi]|uniref:ATP-binding protein n=1 Tax=Ruegeria pomeroyi TaxID=89184 RepID=UPI001F24169A|nr:ATP-binding protein [Ruegeria pomeroyi]MCE8510531.1 restriction endonuclease [Ruegeria pomeroyi]